MKSKYTNELVKKICDMYAEGVQVEIMCKKCDITRNTYYWWQREKPEFAAAVKEAQTRRDKHLNDIIEDAAYKAATGYDVTETKEVYTIDENGNEVLKSREKATKHIQANTTMNMFLLVNRTPDRYQSINKEKIIELNTDLIDKLTQKIADNKNI